MPAKGLDNGDRIVYTSGMENPNTTNLVSVTGVEADKAAALAVTYERKTLAALKELAAIAGITGEAGWKKRDYVVAIVHNAVDIQITHRAPCVLRAGL